MTFFDYEKGFVTLGDVVQNGCGFNFWSEHVLRCYHLLEVPRSCCMELTAIFWHCMASILGA